MRGFCVERRKLSNFINKFLNNLVPAQCLLCKADCVEQAICTDCQRELPYLTQAHCPICALPNLDSQPCGACLRAPPAFDCIRAGFLYQDILSQLIPAAKFGGRWPILGLLTELMLHNFQVDQRPDYLIPLPLHPNRLRERGFNQAQEIARLFTKQLNIDLRGDALQRVRDTEHQARLSEKARHKNMRHAFLASPEVAGKHIALIDDVITTGASLDAASRALKKAGARRVEAWVLARTPAH